MSDEPLAISDLDADDIDEQITVKGNLAKVTEKKPLMTVGGFECQNCGTLTNVPQPRMILQEPHECDNDACDNGYFRLNARQSTFVDQRKVKLEMPPDEGAVGGQSATVFVTGDLCDIGGENGLPDRAGAPAEIDATFNLDESQLYQRNASPEFDTWLDADAIDFPTDKHEDVDIETHIDEIHEIVDSGDGIDTFRDNIVPTLDVDERFEYVLEAAVAWLFGSYRIDVDEGTYRGDIHMCVIGDPGTGKSTLLSELSRISPKCEYRSGEGLTKVGLTCAAVREEFAGTSKWTLEPGVLPRANGGHCIIDEVDKGSGDTTDAIHDALEGEQMVKVDKAGMTASLPTRAGLLASGNPIHGRFDRYEPVAEQIDLDPALISRMDVLLDLPDEVDEDRDRSKAQHYVQSHDELSRVELADRGVIDEEPELDAAARDVSTELLRAWVAYARENVFPTLTDEAKHALTEFYVDVRDLNGGHEDKADTIPATPRTLGAGIRMSIAFARAELCDEVQERHVERAIEVSKEVVGLNFDPETGEFDANKMDTGDMARWRKVKRVVASLEDTIDDSVPVDQAIASITADVGLDESTAEHEIEKLKQKGEIYEPETDSLRVA